jgi:hypothetical protein
MRIDNDLLAEVDAYAEERLSNRTAIVHAALREFLEEARGGVPDLPAMGEAQREVNARRGRQREARAVLEQAPGSSRSTEVGTPADARGTVAPASARAPRPAISPERVEAMRRAAARKGS